MNKFFTILLLLSVFAIQAQVPLRSCGTEMPEDFRQKYYSKNMDYLFEQTPGARAMRWVPVVYHILTKDDGTGGISLKLIFDSHCELNEAYNKFDIGFFIYAIDSIKSNSLYSNTYPSSWSVFPTYNTPAKCNIYISPDLDVCGFATYPGMSSGGGIFLNKSCYGAGSSTLQHEMGHFMGLPHTFEDTNPVEYVNGSNCATKGDRFCDTPADFVDYRAPCPYNGNQTDPNGDLYKNVIDESLYMSYFYDACQNKFSPMQQIEMNNTLTQDRPELLNQTVPDINALPAPVFVSPVDGDTTLLAGSTIFRWNKVPGAQYYHFKLQTTTSTLMLADTVVRDTFFTYGNLLANKNYKYRAKAISYGNTCGNYTAMQFANSSSLLTSVANVKPSCSGDADGSITVTPLNGVAPFSYIWSNGSTTNSSGSVIAGFYTVTITDAAGEVAISTFEIKNPELITVGISKVGNNLNAMPEGGTPPYTYSWSNGEIYASNNNISFGTYSVTVTDSKGCEAQQTFVYSSLGIDLTQQVSLSVYPNPVNSNHAFIATVTINEAANAMLSVFDMKGALLSQQKTPLSSGSNHIEIATTGFAPGIYFLQYTSGEVVHTVRFSVM